MVAAGVESHVGAIGGAPPPGGVSAARLGADVLAAAPRTAVEGGAAALIAAPLADRPRAAGLAAETAAPAATSAAIAGISAAGLAVAAATGLASAAAGAATGFAARLGLATVPGIADRTGWTGCCATH